MEIGDQEPKSRVVKVESKQSWDILMSQASSQNAPVFVHFGASWCVPSLSMNPYFDELSVGHEDVIVFEEVASMCNVRAMPTFLLMKDGAEMDRMIGANPEELLKRLQVCHSLVLPINQAE
ncbi:uncharacterized protein A4U43_C07F38000 [Asparagus officinalis]|uniref:Thioredoxin domain-containing protein n=1 Tax=Asparagus officinalis TaxID=4686 RepID=A0A5P1EHV8_ASPOF|nr:uncharacterized protein A4U43_C07F38000 [Asparagus officinalis]